MKKVAEKNLKKNDHRCIAAPVKIGTQKTQYILTTMWDIGVLSDKLVV